MAQRFCMILSHALVCIGIFLLPIQHTAANENSVHACYHASYGSIVKAPDHVVPCGATSATSGNKSCCAIGSNHICLSDSLCYDPNTLGGTYYLGSCTDPTYSAPECPLYCSDSADKDEVYVIYDRENTLWRCCYSNPDGSPNCSEIIDETFEAPAPQSLSVIYPSSAANPAHGQSSASLFSVFLRSLSSFASNQLKARNFTATAENGTTTNDTSTADNGTPTGTTTLGGETTTSTADNGTPTQTTTLGAETTTSPADSGTQSTTSSDTTFSSPSGGLSPGVIAGIAIGAAGLVSLVAGCWYRLRRRARTPRSDATDGADPGNGNPPMHDPYSRAPIAKPVSAMSPSPRSDAAGGLDPGDGNSLLQYLYSRAPTAQTVSTMPPDRPQNRI